MCAASASVDFTQRTSHRWSSLVEIQHHLNTRLCHLVCFVIWEYKNVYMCFLGRRERLSLRAEEEKERKRREMDEGSSGALGVLIIHCSVVGSELAISPWLYPCLMIWAVPLSLSLQLLWPNKEKGRAKNGFYSSNYATFTINIPQSPLFYVLQSIVTSIKWPQWGVYEYGCWDGGSSCTPGQSRSSSAQKLKLSAGSRLNKWGEGALFLYLLFPFTLSVCPFFCEKRSLKCQVFQECCLSDNTVRGGMATVDGHNGHVTAL